MVLVTAGRIVRALRTGLAAVTSDDNQGVEIQSRTFAAVHGVVTVRVERIADAVLVLAVRRKRNHIRCHVQHKSCGRVEDVAPEVQNQRGEDEHHPSFHALVAHHVGKTLVEERGLIDYVRAHGGIVRNHLLQVERVPYPGDVVTASDIAAAVCQSIFRIFREPYSVYEASDEEDLAPVHLACTGQSFDLVALLHCYCGIAPDLGGELRFSGTHRSYQKNPASRAREIKMREGLMNLQRGKSQTFEKIFACVD